MLNGKKPCNFKTYISRYKIDFRVVDAASPVVGTDENPCEYKSLDDLKKFSNCSTCKSKRSRTYQNSAMDG